MRNRRQLFVLVGALAAVVLLVGSGSFSMTTADRGVTVDVVGDEDAYMALVYDNPTVNVEESEQTEFLTVRNQFAEDGVTVTVDPAVDADNLKANFEDTSGTLDIGEELESQVTFTCDGVSGEQDATVSFDVTADGDGVFVETTEERTVRFNVDCGEPAGGQEFGVKFPGKNAQIRSADTLDDSNATIWMLDNETGTVQMENVSVKENGKIDTQTTQGNGIIIGVYLDGTDTTYINPGLDWTNKTVSSPGEGSNEVTDWTCDGYLNLSEDDAPCEN